MTTTHVAGPRRALFVASILLLGGLPACGAAEHSREPTASAAASNVRRTLIGREPAHEAGWETRLYLIEYPPGASAPMHVHPAVGVGWVVEGDFESAFGDEPIVRVRAGQGFVDAAGVPHRVFRNASADRALRFVVAYTIQAADEPLRVLARADD